MTALHALAEAVGLAREWRDARDAAHVVADETLAMILERLGYGCADERAIAASLARRAAELAEPPALITADVGAPVPLPAALRAAAPAALIDERGGERALALVAEDALAPVAEPGYYRLVTAGRQVTLAVAPRRCFALSDLGGRKRWGVAVQIPALRETEARPYGGLGELARAAARFGALGADALAISPVHALYPGIGSKFSPYSPSSRLFLNASLADPALLGLPPLPSSPGGALIDWQAALPRRLAELRAVFAGLDPASREQVAEWTRARGSELARHALFDALLCHFAPHGAYGWRDWPEAFHDPAGPTVQAFAREHPEEVAFHAFAQWLASRGLAAAQAAARGAGMAVGLIADLAVGTDPGGSDAWSLGEAMFRELSIGAPPDPLGPQGQNWGLTGFSPLGLRRNGYAPWIAMIRAALAQAGGLRIDHAFGLQRLWIIPAGHPASAGAYLAFPFDDLLRLIALESHRARAIVVAEDLGTTPHGFSQAIAERAVLGMRVLWFERDGGEFKSPERYAPESAAMTGTHDLPTVAGWWRGRDLAWADTLGRLPAEGGRAAEDDARARDRAALWRTIGRGAPQPGVDDPAPAVDAALAHIGRAASGLAIAPLEDLLALDEQPNIPGTIDEHPNWRRRLAAPLGELLDDPAARARIDALDTARRE